MSKQIHDRLARGEARVVAGPVDTKTGAPRHQVEVDRNFELPTALYATTVGMYLAFLAVMFVSLSTPTLIIPMVIFTVSIIAGFAIPTIWTRFKGNESKPMTLGKFSQVGIMTHTGQLAPRDAAIQVLLLPVLVAIWGCAAVVIIALV